MRPEVEIEDDDEVERPLGGNVVDHIGGHPLDLDVPLAGESPRLGDGDAREIDRRHAPPSFRKPDRVTALAGGDVESAPRLEPLDFLDEEAIRLGPPLQLGLGVARVPLC